MIYSRGQYYRSITPNLERTWFGNRIKYSGSISMSSLPLALHCRSLEEVMGFHVCKRCGGTGWVWGQWFKPFTSCPECDGTGRMRPPRPNVTPGGRVTSPAAPPPKRNHGALLSPAAHRPYGTNVKPAGPKPVPPPAPPRPMFCPRCGSRHED